MVGGTGSVVDAGVMEALVACGLPAAMARLLSILTALQVTYFLHGTFTFRDHDGYRLRGWAKFMGCNLTGALINYLLFLAVLSCTPFGEPRLDRLTGLVVGTGVALWFNYWANRRFVFACAKKTEDA